MDNSESHTPSKNNNQQIDSNFESTDLLKKTDPQQEKEDTDDSSFSMDSLHAPFEITRHESR